MICCVIVRLGFLTPNAFSYANKHQGFTISNSHPKFYICKRRGWLQTGNAATLWCTHQRTLQTFHLGHRNVCELANNGMSPLNNVSVGPHGGWPDSGAAKAAQTPTVAAEYKSNTDTDACMPLISGPSSLAFVDCIIMKYPETVGRDGRKITTSACVDCKQ